MALAFILNLILCIALLIAVVAPLIWAIVIQHRDQPVIATTPPGIRGTEPRMARRARRPLPEPIVWPAR